jgi:hypothetical protein
VFDTVSGMSSPLPYMPWVSGEFRWRLGMRPLELAEWIQIGDDYDAQMAVKRAARTDHPSTVFVALAEATPAWGGGVEPLGAPPRAPRAPG